MDKKGFLTYLRVQEWRNSPKWPIPWGEALGSEEWDTLWRFFPPSMIFIEDFIGFHVLPSGILRFLWKNTMFAR